jgi:hypothetical protein
MSAHTSTAHMRQNVRRALLFVSFLLFPVTFYYLSPYLIIMGAGERTASGSMVVFSVMTLTAIVLGRLFCGWVCPAGGLGEALFAVQNRKANNRRNWTRWLVSVPWMTMVTLVTLRAGGIMRVDPPVPDRPRHLADDCKRHGTLHHLLRSPRADLRPVTDGWQARILSPCLLDGSVHDDREGSPQHPPPSCHSAAHQHTCVCRLPCLHGCVPDEPRGRRDGPEPANGEQRMHPVRHLRRCLPPQRHPLRLRQASFHKPHRARETITALRRGARLR